MTVTFLEHTDGRVVVEELASGRRRIRVEPRDERRYVPYREWETAYPLPLIEQILQTNGTLWLCDEIGRDEDPGYVRRDLELMIMSRMRTSDLEHARILDFGCGSGASTVNVARLFPRLEVVGVELEADKVAIGEARVAHYGLTNVAFHLSPDPESLPDGIGTFEFVLLSAVWEHLLPNERACLARQLWDVLTPEGVLFLNQTPFRWNLIESHTTGLPLLNFLPATAAHWAALRFSKMVSSTDSWEVLLRKGIRGGSESEVLALLSQAGEPGTLGAAEFEPALVEPSLLGMHDRIDLWYTVSQAVRPLRSKAAVRELLKALRRLTGRTFTPSIDLAIRKHRVAVGESPAVADG